MLPTIRFALATVVALALCAGSLQAGDLDSLKQGTPDIKSVGALAFGPEGILFVGDATSGAIFALDTGDRPSAAAMGALKVDKIDERIGALLGTTAKEIRITDLAVSPVSGNAYLSVMRGQGAEAKPVIVRADRKGEVKELALKDVKFAKTMLPNPTTDPKQRPEAITGMAYVKGKLFVAGLSSEEFASNLRAIPFPFTTADKGTGVEIFHGAHGKFETRSPVRTFVTYEIKGEPYLLAGYTCTPLVKFPVASLKPGEKLKGTTIAELGSGNRPLDMLVYEKGGKDFILIANNNRGIMKVPTDNIDKIEGITTPVKGTAGLTYETIKDLKGVLQMAKLDKTNALVLMRTAEALNLETVPLP